MRFPPPLRLPLAIALFLSLAVPVAADEGWVISRLDIRLDIQPDGTVNALDAIDVDFRGLSKHGIFRDIDVVFNGDPTHNREYPIDLVSVTAADGRRHQVQTSMEGATKRFKIGDPNQTLSGKETYRIAYRIGRALNAFSDHDELYWNATGKWPVLTEHASVVVKAPAGSLQRGECFQGFAGSKEPCTIRLTPNEVTFTAGRALAEGEQLTVVAVLRKGVVPEPQPLLVAKPRMLTDFFDRTPALLTLMGAACLAVVGGLGALWWRVGRDRRYVALHYGPPASGAAAAEERVPLLGDRPLAVEFQPPDNLRPGQMGLLIDERADTLDVTATIVDLAVRGYFKITEVPKAHFFSSKDWHLERLKDADAGLLEYERIVFKGLFGSGHSTQLSLLKNKFYTELEKAKGALYKDAVSRGWFPKSPKTVRGWTVVLGVLMAATGVVLTIVLGRTWGAGLVAVPIVVGGVLVMMFLARAMPRRTAAGRNLLRRTLGFARYIKTAETHQQAFAERANIFTAYLPYAITFKCVDLWAKAFKDIDVQAATAGWYAGTSSFNAGTFSSSLGSFSSSVSSSVASTPGSSGSSGSGGSSGGGGGGGGGGSW